MPVERSSLAAVSPMKRERRRAMFLGLANGALWAAGNALTAGPLVSYLAQELGARGLALSLLLATPSVVGLLRLATPSLVGLLGTAKRTCLFFSIVSYILLALLPPLVLSGDYARFRVPGLIALLCVHQLLEFVAAAALLAWLGDLVPRRVRGRYFARREIAKLVLAMPTLLASGALIDRWIDAHPGSKIAAYAVATGVGVGLLLLSLLPLWAMPSTAISMVAVARSDWKTPFRDPKFWRFLTFGCWSSAANGLTQSAQGIVPVRMLDISYGWTAMFRTGMQLGQIGVAPIAGHVADRRGNRPVLVACQILTATSMLWFGLSVMMPGWGPFWIAGAYAAWAFFAGHNVCVPNLALRLAAPSERASYVAAYFAVTSVFHATATVAGGILWDWMAAWPGATPGSRPLPAAQYVVWLFVAAWLLRSLAVLPLARLEESPKR